MMAQEYLHSKTVANVCTKMEFPQEEEMVSHMAMGLVLGY
jgi:hypothetical protein